MLQYRICTHAIISRNLRTAAVLQKQPAHDRQRRRRKDPPPFHRLPFYKDDPLKNLKMDQLFPPSIPGSWGSTKAETKEKL